MVSIKLFWILLLGVVAASLAETVEVEEKELVEKKVEESESSEEDDEDTRGFFVDNQGQNRCNCEGLYCLCCVNPNIPIVGRVKSCLKVSLLANEKAVEFELSGRDIVVGKQKMVVGSTEVFCANVPGSRRMAQGCVDAKTSSLPNNDGFQTCPKVELKALGRTIATLNVACVQYASGKVSFNDNGVVKAAQRISYKLL